MGDKDRYVPGELAVAFVIKEKRSLKILASRFVNRFLTQQQVAKPLG